MYDIQLKKKNTLGLDELRTENALLLDNIASIVTFLLIEWEIMRGTRTKVQFQGLVLEYRDLLFRGI